MVFWLFLGSGISAMRLEEDLISGDSLLGDSERLNGISSTVAYHLTVENYSNRTLVAHQHKASGWTKLEQKTILPQYAEAMMGSKTGWTATGCTGTATWKIGDTGKMLVVMWSIPFDQNWYSNWCAVGIMPVQEDTSDLWDKMYYGPELNFTRKEFYDSDPRLDYTTPDFAVYAGMGSSHKTYMTVTFCLKEEWEKMFGED